MTGFDEAGLRWTVIQARHGFEGFLASEPIAEAAGFPLRQVLLVDGRESNWVASRAVTSGSDLSQGRMVFAP